MQNAVIYSERTVNHRISVLKSAIIESIKYDAKGQKAILVVACARAIGILRLLRFDSAAFELASRLYRTGWKNSETIGLEVANYYFGKRVDRGRKIIRRMLNDVVPLPNTRKFIDDPSLMLDGVIMVLKEPTNREKGVVIINYSYYFTLFYKYFMVREVLERFHLILEPSWAGLCESNIMAYTLCDCPVYIQVYEERDRRFIRDLKRNLVPVRVGPSWFVDHETFSEGRTEEKAADAKDIDLIMVAAWAYFKRHASFFKAIRPLKERRPGLRIALVGYPVDFSQSELLESARLHGVEENIEIHEWISPLEVRDLFRRSKLNVLWSKFEGNNRAIAEGMFCGVPCIMRRGHNYGERYSFINEETGMFSTESSLSDDVEHMLSNLSKYSPRSYMKRSRNCVLATRIMNDTIKTLSTSYGEPWSADLAVKVNGLHGMSYFGERTQDFKASYEWLRGKICPQSGT